MEPRVDLNDVRRTAETIKPYAVTTPICAWPDVFADGTTPILKLELLQRTGTFKARGALANVAGLDASARARGVTAVSAGNHAVAVAFAAAQFGINAKVVMLSTANPVRVTAARRYGAEVLMAENGAAGFALAEKLAADEGRTFVHPFEGPTTVLGTATLGLEFASQAPDLDALIVAVGGGGLAAGVSAAFKQLQPNCRIYGVEPEGADTMHRSFAAGTPQRADAVNTIADSLAPPTALPYSFAVCRANIDQLVKVTDEQICAGMAALFGTAKLAVEPAGAAAMAALLFPLRKDLAGKRVGVIVCGANIDVDSFSRFVTRGLKLL